MASYFINSGHQGSHVLVFCIAIDELTREVNCLLTVSDYKELVKQKENEKTERDQNSRNPPAAVATVIAEAVDNEQPKERTSLSFRSLQLADESPNTSWKQAKAGTHVCR